MATIHDVARRAGVSTFTVSAALNKSARVSARLSERVFRAAAELDYTINRLASSLQTGRSTTSGMLIPDVANPFYAKVVRGVEDVCREQGYSLLLGNSYNRAEEQARYVNAFRSRQVDGLLLFLAPDSENALAPIVAKGTPPMIFVGRRPRTKLGLSVVADNRGGTRLAVEHLIGLGHRRIGLLTGQPALSASADRVRGWRDALRAAALEAPGHLALGGDWSSECSRAQTLELLRLKKPPTALFTASLPILIGALDGARTAGAKVPRDLEVMSSDDSEWLDVFEPRISVVVQPSYEMGTAAARLLLARISGTGGELRSVVLKPELKLR